MTYPPQDPGAVPPGSPAGDAHGQSQPAAQPPAGGYPPGQVGADPAAQPTTQVPAAGYGQSPYPGQPYQGQPYPGQPDPNAAYYPQQGYDPNQPYGQYGQYGPPPVQATSKGGGTALLVIGVVLLMVVGAIAGYLILGNDDEGELSAGEDSTTSEAAPPDDEGQSGEEQPSEEEAPAPSGTDLAVTSLNSSTPIPEGEWQSYYGPGESYIEPLADSEAYAYYHTETWISFFGVGLYSSASAVYDPSDLEASAASAAEVWLTDAFSTVEGYEQGEITYTEVEVDGKSGVLAEWRNSWTSTDATTDLYEDTAILVVDVDGVNGFLGIASIAESGTDSYASAVESLLATDFDAADA